MPSRFVALDADEPVGDERFPPAHRTVGPDELPRHVRLPGRHVICTGRDRGSAELAQAFFEGGSASYLAPAGAQLGYARVVAVTLVFYELTRRRLDEAVVKLAAMWRLFRAPKPPDAPTTAATA